MTSSVPPVGNKEPENFFVFKDLFCLKLEFWGCAFYFIYLKGYTFMTSTENRQKSDHPTPTSTCVKTRKPTPLYRGCWTFILWHSPLTRLKPKNFLSQLHFGALSFINQERFMAWTFVNWEINLFHVTFCMTPETIRLFSGGIERQHISLECV